MAEKRFIVEVEPSKPAKDGKPSIGPVYRNIFAKDGFPPPIPGLESCWDIFRLSVEKYPNNRMLGRREIVDGKVLEDDVEFMVLIPRVDHKYGGTPPACNAHGLYCVPLYDTLGAGSIEYIICHAEIALAFVEEKKISEGESQNFDLPMKKRTDICTIMYTSGTTGDPKGVMISNNSIVTLIAGVKCMLQSVNEADVKLLVEDIGELRPTIFAAVPRVLDRIYSGLTETCAGTFVSIPDEMNMLGTVGPPLANVDVCLESVPEMGVRCPFNNASWRRDIGEWQPDGSLKIIDRKKNIFKLSQGEYVAVENLENIYGLVPDIDSIWIYGNSFEYFLVAIINPNKQAVEEWAEQNGIPGDFTALCENPLVKEYFLGELKRIAKEKKLKGFEFIKAVHLDPVQFDMERDLITPTFKKKRPQLLKYYQDVIDRMYKAAK
ncbi:hypothetical protein DH2020_036340 [Rehmannia glutinosa]|uniref:AMP-dependent synthetase/ligase domain-containing protein n=1 Tax=Rehmannia glutinosa TaxID=99300 RepID=A0ABR0V6J7_REHGL